jgi:CBS domain-containing protein
MTTVADILKAKPSQEVHTIEPAATVLEAVRRMADANIGALVVLEHAQVVGMVSERDYARKLLVEERTARSVPVKEIMSAPVLVVQPTHTSDECMALMTQYRLRHLPVVDRGRLIGLVSIGDLVKQVISEQRFVIEQLEHYIAGDRA